MNIGLNCRSWRKMACASVTLTFAPFFVACLAAGAEEPVSYSRQIQPILAKACFACHGPDSQHRQADLRLDQASAAHEHAIAAGDPAASLLVERIESVDQSLVMPPPDSGQALTPAQKELIKAWIAQGAHYENHWAFEPIVRPQVPSLDDEQLSNPIDRFVRSQLKSQGILPSPPAQPHQRLRRLYFDLIGLPADEAVAVEFLRDPSDQRFQEIVEQLLRSPHYGEHMAVTWLDLARYADTNGYQNDFYRSQWPWRDWVIQSFNNHQRYDEFLVEQIAGDLLPNPTPQQLTATGFNRNNRSVTEGGSIEEEWRVENCVDRVEATATAFLGLTIGCARCHDHKYDPISQRDFYQFFAFFNNIDEQGVYIETRGNTGPQLKVPTEAQLSALADVETRLSKLQDQLATENEQTNRSAKLSTWATDLSAKLSGSPLPLPVPTFRKHPMQDVIHAASKAADAPGDASSAEFKDFGPTGPALRFDGQAAQIALGDHWDKVDRETPFTWSVWVEGSARGALFSKMDDARDHRGFDGIVLDNGHLKIHLIHHWNRDAIAIISKTALTPNAWQLVTVTYDGSSTAAGLSLYLNGKKLAVDVEVDSLTGTIQNLAGAYLGQRNGSVYLRGQISDFAWFDKALTEPEVERWRQQSLLDTWQQTHESWRQHPELMARIESPLAAYLLSVEPHSVKQQLQEASEEKNRLLASQQTVMIMRDRGEYRPTFLLKRGQYDLPETSEALWPQTPSALPRSTDDQPANRLGLARWMVDEKNPLVARVAVNRIWAHFFGTGLVDPLDNFGVQAAPPSHPELLDWLAAELRDSGWNVQHIQRLIVSSRTYQQASEHASELAALDPDNRLLWRGPRKRLTGEQLRDQALAVAKLLQPTIGGPSVFPYQPAGLWEELAGGANDGPYRESTGPDLYRRGLYTYRKRTVSHPTVASFDAPSWEICYAQRAITNTPLQSLALLNGPTYVEAARHLADRVLQSHPQMDNESHSIPTFEKAGSSAAAAMDAGLDTLFRWTLLRSPSDGERQRLKSSFVENLRHYRQHSEQADQLLQVGQRTPSGQWDRATWAALTITASTIMNTDEFITKE